MTVIFDPAMTRQVLASLDLHNRDKVVRCIYSRWSGGFSYKNLLNDCLVQAAGEQDPVDHPEEFGMLFGELVTASALRRRIRITLTVSEFFNDYRGCNTGNFADWTMDEPDQFAIRSVVMITFRNRSKPTRYFHAQTKGSASRPGVYG
jgi:hypothetical protein